MPYPDFPLFGLWYICMAMASCLGVARKDGVTPPSYRFFDSCCDFSILPRILIKGMMVACRSVFFTLVPWQASIGTFALCKCRADHDLRSDYVTLCCFCSGKIRCCPEVLLLLITYVFSVAFMTFSRGTPLEKGAFQSMGSAVMALIMKGILPDQARSGGCLVRNTRVSAD